MTERAAYIGRIRNLARAVAQSYLESRARLGFPMAPRAWADEVVAQIASKQPGKDQAPAATSLAAVRGGAAGVPA